MSNRSHRAWPLLARYLGPQRGRVAALAVLLLASIGMQLLIPQVIRLFIDRAAAGSATRELLGIGGLFLGIALVGQAVAVGATYLSARVGWDATNWLRADLLTHGLHLDMPFHNTHTPGEMIERVDGDVTVLSNFFSQVVINIVGNALLLLGVVIVLAREEWRVGLAMGAFVLITLIVLIVSRSVAVPAVTAERESSASLFGLVEERLAGLDDIRANGGGPHAMNRLNEEGAQVIRMTARAQRRTMAVWTGAMAMFTVGYMLSLGMGAHLYREGAITLGTVYLFFAYAQALRRPLELIAEQFKELQRAGAGIARVRDLLSFSSTLRDGTDEFAGLSSQFAGQGTATPATENCELRTVNSFGVRFERVSFGYQAGEPVLHDLSFEVSAGRVLGVVGRTGCGKSTLTRLLLRLYDPTAGAIMLGGADLRDLRLDALHAAVGIVTQDVQVFQASVRDNLTLFDDAIADARIVATLDDLGLGAWFRSLPDGLDTELASSGGGLSAGEAQLLACARVFLRDPGLVILDEASSRLDPATERLIERAIDRLLTGRTGIVIAHRLHTVQRADDILVLDGGRILEHGPRATLAADPTSRFASLLRTGLETPETDSPRRHGGTEEDEFNVKRSTFFHQTAPP